MLAIEQAETAGTVRQVRRLAIKRGDDYITLENEVTLPAGATDAQIAEAVATGMRIAAAQAAAQEQQLDALLGQMPEPQPTKPQLMAVGRLRAKVSDATTAAVYRELGIEGPEPRTRGQASLLIDRLQAILNGSAPDPAVVPEEPAAEGEQKAEAEEADLPF
jgi:hypothetical protein